MHPVRGDALLRRNRRRYARPPRVDRREGQRAVVILAIRVRVALAEVLLVAGGDLVLDEADDVGECERLLADSTSQDVLMEIRFRAVCICCNKTRKGKSVKGKNASVNKALGSFKGLCESR